MVQGIWFSVTNNIQNSMEKIFKPILSKAKQICGTWTNRSLSMKGKVTVANSLIISLFQYPCTYIYTPPEVFNEFRTNIRMFIWDNKKPKVAYISLIQPIVEGGLNLIDLEVRTKAALLQRVRRLIAEPRLPSAAFLRMIIQVDDLKETFRAKLPGVPKPVKEIPYKAHNFYPQDETSIRQEALWDNKWITNAGGMLGNKEWA